MIAVGLAQARTAHPEEGEVPGEIMVTAAGYSEREQGEAVSLSLDLTEAVLFSAEDGRRLSPANAAG